jgi:diamine N-acetyltransferase
MRSELYCTGKMATQYLKMRCEYFHENQPFFPVVDRLSFLSTFFSIAKPQMSAPSRNSVLTYREVTEHNWRAVANLSLKDGQKGNLAANVWSLAGAAYSEDAWVRTIYADETLVGMLMLATWDPDEAYYIWRFMIDDRYQNQGYSRRGIEYAIAHIRQHNPQA